MKKLYLFLTAFIFLIPFSAKADSLCGMLGSGILICPSDTPLNTLNPSSCSITASTDASRAVQLEALTRLVTGLRESIDAANQTHHLCYLYSKLECNLQPADVVTPEMRAAFADKCTAILFPPAGPTTPPDPTPPPAAPFDPKEACKMINEAKGLCGNKLVPECGTSLSSMAPGDITLVKKACMESGSTLPLEDCSKKFCESSTSVSSTAASSPGSTGCSLSLANTFNTSGWIGLLFLALPFALRLQKRKVL